MFHTEASAPGIPIDHRRAASNYDRLSRWYDLLSGPFEARWRDLTLRRLNLAPGQTVLEIGYGTGHGLIRLAEAVGPTGRVYGVDLSAGMCRVAHARSVRSGQPVISVIQGDAATLPFAAGGFAAVFMSFTLELFSPEGVARVLTECRRVLAADGRLGVVALDRWDRATLMTRLYGWAGRRYPHWIDCRPIPVADTLSGHGFCPVEVIAGSVGGLPLAVVIALKNDQ